MNNSQIAIDNVSLSEEEVLDTKPLLRQRETELIEIIEGLEHISSSRYWKVIERVFIKDFNSLQKQLRNEKNPTEIYRLQGRITQAEKTDLSILLQAARLELQNLRKNLNAN
jgi:hypothetical protein